jgi:hypothetical protein
MKTAANRYTRRMVNPAMFGDAGWLGFNFTLWARKMRWQ